MILNKATTTQLEKALDLKTAGELDAAQTLFSSDFRSEPKNAVALFLAAAIEFGSKNFNMALKHIQPVTVSNPNFSQAHLAKLVLLKNEISKYICYGYDYVGAPWPKGYFLAVNTVNISLKNGITSTTFVCNGGLSLRKIRSYIRLIQEFPELTLTWPNKAHAENLFFAYLSTVSDFLKMPNIKVVTKFSHDIDPGYLSKLIGNEILFGIHAWSKYDRDFWTNHAQWPVLGENNDF